MHRQTAAPGPGWEAQSRSTNPTGNATPLFDVPHLPIILKWYSSSVVTMYILGHRQYLKSDRGALNRIPDLQLLGCANLF